MSGVMRIDRRGFLKIGGLTGGGLVLGVWSGASAAPWASQDETFKPNAFVQVDTDGTVRIWVAKMEMGQGVRTSLPMIVAEELDADWESVEVVQADADRKYGRQMTVGSSSVRRGAWMPLRRAGAAARQMLIGAAAARWGVDAAGCRTEAGRVVHDASGNSASYGELAGDAASQPVPEEPTLKDPADFRIIGTPVSDVDCLDKVTGRAAYGLDARVPGMLFATVVHCPVFAGSVESFDASRALEVEGVEEVFEVSQGVAVVATNTWAAFRGAQALEVTWDEGDFATVDSERIFEHLRETAASGEPAVARDDGDARAALAQAERRVSATYEAPYLAHATMEPMNCTAHVQADRCEIWVPTQGPQGAQRAAAQITGLPAEAVTVHPTLLGCGLGRRGATDFVRDAVETSMKVGRPVQMTWTREEDMRHDFYRPAAHVELEGGLDAEGRATALSVRVSTPPVGFDPARPGGGGRGGGRRGGRGDGPRPDRNAMDGLVTMPYGLADCLMDYCRPEISAPTGYWRSVGPSQNAFIIEGFIDELAHAAGRDPLEFRLELLQDSPRIRHVLERAADEASWGSAPPAGRARGIGLVIDKGGHVAQVHEVSMQDGRPRVHKVTCAVDCGIVINPNVVEQQVVGCVVNGLAAALYGEITLRNGRVTQSNFNNYELLRIDEMPEVEVHLIDSTEEPGGAGEPALPPTAPALVNAIHALTGVRIRTLPIANHLPLAETA